MNVTSNVNVGGTGTDVGLHVGGNLGLGLDLEGHLLDNMAVSVSIPVIHLDPIHLDPIHLDPIKLGITDIPPIVTDSKVALDLKVAVTELPKIKLEFGFTPMRMHFPTHYQMCFSLFGKEVFKFALCGESMIACEHYHPHETEKCG